MTNPRETARRITAHHAAAGGPLTEAHPAPTDDELDAAVRALSGPDAPTDPEALDASWIVAQECGRRAAREAGRCHRPKSVCFGCWTIATQVAAETIAEDGWPNIANVTQAAEADLASDVVRCAGPGFCDGMPK